MSALVEALVAAQADLPCAIGKDSDGQIQNRSYRYLSLDKLIEATRPTLTKHGLAIIQCPTYVLLKDAAAAVPMLTTRLVQCQTDEAYQGGTLQHGDYLEWQTPLYVEPKTMQGLGAAITYARRYAWQAVLGIAAEEDTDAAERDADVPF